MTKTNADELKPNENKLLLAVALLPPPVTLDNLAWFNKSSLVETLQSLENLVARKVLKHCKGKGAGYYQLPQPQEYRAIVQACSKAELCGMMAQLIAMINDGSMKPAHQSLSITNILCTANVFDPAEVAHVIRAADYCLGTGDIEAATIYYQFILDHCAGMTDTVQGKTLFMNATLGLISSYGHLKPLIQQRLLLNSARQIAVESNDLERLCMISLRLAQVLKTEGKYQEASVLYEEAWELANRLNSDDLLKQAALFTSDFLFWQGLVADAIARYEQVIGDLEKFPADQATLRACATLGWCYGICGQTARGAGLIQAVLGKAKELNLLQIEVYADLMAVLNLLEARRIQEAAVFLDEIFKHGEETLGNYIACAAYSAKALILYSKGDLPECFRFQTKSYDKAKEAGWFHNRGPYNFDYMDALEDAGLIHPEMNYASEIKRLSNWPDVYMQGVGLRYKAQRLLRCDGVGHNVIEDLKRGMELLTRAGAKLELSRAQVLLARINLKEGSAASARMLLKEASAVLDAVNPELFPEDLRSYIDEEEKENFIINTLLEVNSVVGTVSHRDRLLERIINLLLRLTSAGRGGCFLIGSENQLELVASRNLDTTMVDSDLFRSSNHLLRKVIQDRKEIVKPESSVVTNGWVLCFPLMLRERVMGAIYLDNTLAGLTPPKNIITLLKVITSQLAIAINNAESYTVIERLKDRLEDETRFYRMELGSLPQGGQIIGKSRSIQEVLEHVERVSATDATVLITGETGVGKELIARAIHQRGLTKAGPFIPVNAASLDSGVIASELFGHEKGAFTGASQLRRGRFELADGGTLFLDDIDTIPLDIQAKILRAIQEKEFERVGGCNLIKSNFRLIAATNQDLGDLIGKGRFRADLFYRLNVFPVHIGSLRERKEDIPLLAYHFLDFFSIKFGKRISKIPNSTLQKLTAYNWPGNVRELKHIIERAVILSDNDHMVLPELNQRLKSDGAQDKFLPFREMERVHILAALKACKGKVSGPGGAAKLLELKPTTLYAKIRSLGIQKNLS